MTVGDRERYRTTHEVSVEGGFVGVQIAVKGRSAGALYVAEKEDDSDFTADDERLLDLFAVLAGVHVRLYEEVGHEQKKLAAIQGSMTEGLMVLDGAGRLTDVNDTSGRQWGFEPGDVEGSSIDRVLSPDAVDPERADGLAALVEAAHGPLDAPITVDLTVVRPEMRHL